MEEGKLEGGPRQRSMNVQNDNIRTTIRTITTTATTTRTMRATTTTTATSTRE